MPAATRTVSEELARFVREASYDALPPEAVATIKQCILDQIGVQLVASTLPFNRVVYDYARSCSPAGDSTVTGCSQGLPPLETALVNATFGQGCELDDGGHAGSVTLPVALALGEPARISGRALITAVATGYEVFFRVFDAVMPEILERGFHQQCVVGVFAAAAVAGKLLDLSEEQLVHGFGIAGSHASGTAEYDQSGGEVKRLHAGLAARGGIQAALLARQGLTAPRTIFEGNRGILHTFVADGNSAAITEGLGRRLKFLEQVSFKMYSCCATIHPAIDAMTQLMEEHKFQIDQVEEIRVGVNPAMLRHGAGIAAPEDVIGAQFSLTYSLALRLLFRRNSLELYLEPKLWRDPEIGAVMNKIHVYAAEDMVGERRWPARIQLRLRDGSCYASYQAFRRGSVQFPVSREELVGKFKDLASHVLDPQRIEKVMSTVEHLEGVEDVSTLAALLSSSSTSVRG